MTRRWSAEQLYLGNDGRAKARPKLRLCGEPSESDVQWNVIKLLRYHPKVAWAQRMNSGKGFLSRQRGGNDARWIEFGFEGCSDVLGQMRDGRLMALEIKKAGAYAKPHQRQFIETVKANGGVAGVVRSLDDVIRLLEEKNNEQTAV